MKNSGIKIKISVDPGANWREIALCQREVEDNLFYRMILKAKKQTKANIKIKIKFSKLLEYSVFFF